MWIMIVMFVFGQIAHSYIDLCGTLTTIVAFSSSHLLYDLWPPLTCTVTTGNFKVITRRNLAQSCLSGEQKGKAFWGQASRGAHGG